MNSEAIKIELYRRRRKVTQSSIARSLAVSRQAVEATIQRRIRSRRIMEAVAAAIGHDVKYVFPELIKSPGRSQPS